MAGCTVEDLIHTEREVLVNLNGMDYPQKIKDRVINLTRRTFRLHRGLSIAEQLVIKRKARQDGKLQQSNPNWQHNSGRTVAPHS